MNGNQRTGVICGAFVLLFLVTFIAALTYCGHKGDLEETKRIKACTAVGKQWVDLDPVDENVNYGCIDAGVKVPR